MISGTFKLSSKKYDSTFERESCWMPCSLELVVSKKSDWECALKNVTISIHKVDVVCVQDIKDYSLFEFLFHEDNLE